MKYRVLTHYYGHTNDPNYKDNMEFCCKIAGEFEEDWWTQSDSDEWDYDNHLVFPRQTCSNAIQSIQAVSFHLNQ